MTKFKMAMVAAFVGVAAIGCGELSEDITAYDSTTNSSPTAPANNDTDSDNDMSDEYDIIVTNCESWGMTYDDVNKVCVDDEDDMSTWTTGTIETETVEEVPFNFTVTPGKNKLVATWETNADVSSFRIERTREGNSYSNDSYPTGTEWTYATFFCSAHSFKLVATMMDGSVVETEATDYLRPTNCE